MNLFAQRLAVELFLVLSVQLSDPIKTFGMGESYQHGWNRSVAEAVGTSTSDTATKGTVQSFGKSAADTVTKGLATMASETIAKPTGSAIANTLGRAVTRGTALTSGASRALNLATNFGANFARASAVTAMIGQSEGITQSSTTITLSMLWSYWKHR